jgi:RNA polymerase sigma factor (sigma-70 family)
MLKPPIRQRRPLRTELDERLVELIRSGDHAAFGVVYDRYGPGLLSFCRHLLGSLEEAEDAVQQTFLSAHRAMLGDRRELHLKAWLYAIARNRCMSVLRARRESVELDEEHEAGVSTAGLAAEVEQREDLRDMLEDLARLPDDQRAALVLAEIGAHSHDEIAEVLEVKREKVKALVFQAREALAATRAARDTPCADIREQIATARGGQLRRGNLRRHLDVCDGCRAFKDDVHRQRVAFAAILPVIPSIALKQAILATAAGGAASAGAMGAAGTIAGAGGIKAVSSKVLATIAIAGGAGGTGYVAVEELQAPQIPAAVAEAQPPEREAAAAPSREATPLPPRRATAPTTSNAAPAPARTRPASRRERRAAERRRRRADRGGRDVARDSGTVDAVAPAAPVEAIPVSGDAKKPKKGKKPKKAKKPHPHGGPPGQTKKGRDARPVKEKPKRPKKRKRDAGVPAAGPHAPADRKKAEAPQAPAAAPPADGDKAAEGPAGVLEEVLKPKRVKARKDD